MAGLTSRFANANKIIAAARQRAAPAPKVEENEPLQDRAGQLRSRLELVLPHLYKSKPDPEAMAAELEECLEAWSSDEYFDGAIAWLDAEIKANHLRYPVDEIFSRLGNIHSDPADRQSLYETVGKIEPKDRDEVLAAYNAIYDIKGRQSANAWIQARVEGEADHDGLAVKCLQAAQSIKPEKAVQPEKAKKPTRRRA